MQKSKLGISVGLIAAISYFACIFGGGYTVSILICGYVLLREDNPWLKRITLKAVVLLALFSIASFIINLIPNCIGAINDFAMAINHPFSTTFISSVVAGLSSILDIIRNILFVLLGIKALSQGTIRLPIIDKMLDKYMG